MRRMSILCRITPLTTRRCLQIVLCGIRRNFFRLSPCRGQVTYVLLTRAPVAGSCIATTPLPLDLHVLSLSLAFILSQDQTLRCCLSCFFFFQIKTRQELLFLPFATKPVKARSAFWFPHPGRLLSIRLENWQSKNYYRFLSCTTFVSVVRLSMFSFRLRGFQPFSSAKLRRITEMTKLLFKF